MCAYFNLCTLLRLEKVVIATKYTSSILNGSIPDLPRHISIVLQRDIHP